MPWYDSLFDHRYVGFYEELLDVSVAARDIAFLDRAMALPPACRVLDLGCGFGRHAVELAARGYDVTGVDLSAPMLEMARAQASERKVSVKLEQRDMRSLSGLGPFGACICIYTVLGYFDDAENASVIAAIADVLEPGARLALDLTNPLAMFTSWPGTVWKETSLGVRSEASRYDAMTGRVITERVLFPSEGGRAALPTSEVRLYAPYEVSHLLRSSGFDVEQVYGAMRDTPLQWNRSPRQVWIARRR